MSSVSEDVPHSGADAESRLARAVKSANDAIIGCNTVGTMLLVTSLALVVVVLAMTHEDMFLNQSVTIARFSLSVKPTVFYKLAPPSYLILYMYFCYRLALADRVFGLLDEAIQTEPDAECAKMEAKWLLQPGKVADLFRRRAGDSPVSEGKRAHGARRSLVFGLATLCFMPIVVQFVMLLGALPLQDGWITSWQRVMIFGTTCCALGCGHRLLYPTDSTQSWWRQFVFSLGILVVLCVLMTMALVANHKGESPQISNIQRTLWPACWFSGTGAAKISPWCDLATLLDGYDEDSQEPSFVFQRSLTLSGLSIGKKESAGDAVPEAIEGLADAVRNFDKQIRGQNNASDPPRPDGVSVPRPRDTISLRGRTLIDLRLDNTRLYNIDLTGADLRGLKGRGASLPSTGLHGVKAGQSGGCDSPDRIDLSPDRFQPSVADHSKWNNAELGSISIRRGSMIGTAFDGATIDCADFTDAFAPMARFDTSNSNGTKPKQVAKLKRADFSRAKLVAATFRGAEIGEASSFEKANLMLADFSDATVRRVSFKGGDLRGAKFRNSDLRGVDFTKANLRAADFTDAKLDGAIFWDTKMDFANFNGATIRATTFIGNVSAIDAELQNADLSWSHFKHGSLSLVDLRVVSTMRGVAIVGTKMEDVGLGDLSTPKLDLAIIVPNGQLSSTYDAKTVEIAMKLGDMRKEMEVALGETSGLMKSSSDRKELAKRISDEEGAFAKHRELRSTKSTSSPTDWQRVVDDSRKDAIIKPRTDDRSRELAAEYRRLSAVGQDEAEFAAGLVRVACMVDSYIDVGDANVAVKNMLNAHPTALRAFVAPDANPDWISAECKAVP